MLNAQAKETKEAQLDVFEGQFQATTIPFPTSTPDAQIVNEKGQPVYSRTSLMARLDEKLTEKPGWTNGTVLIISFVLPIVMALFYWGGSLIGVARDDQQKKLEIQQLQNDVNSLKVDAKEIKDTLKNIEVREAYKLGAGTSHSNDQTDDSLKTSKLKEK